ncbi:SDR family NAD(P)-dependent oxidoreductase [Pseudonocardia aurantiaca]|uniref:SDR family NAD(P)-dependent oxidoreductase n=1 Tax=Pseudonocardia aurantiaca TaxID=75290 RepID=A0ABW4FWG2_9PSEU
MTTVLTGGTDGIGRALAGTYLDRGHDVLVVRRNAEKGRAFLEALYYLSRFLFSHGLADLLRRAEHQVVLNFGGAGLTGPPATSS